MRRRMQTRSLDGWRVNVSANEPRFGERTGHQPCRVAMPAADIGNERAGLEPLDHTIERREPTLDQVRPIAGAEELRNGAGDAARLLAPCHACSSSKRLHHRLHV